MMMLWRSPIWLEDYKDIGKRPITTISRSVGIILQSSSLGFLSQSLTHLLHVGDATGERLLLLLISRGPREVGWGRARDHVALPQLEKGDEAEREASNARHDTQEAIR